MLADANNALTRTVHRAISLRQMEFFQRVQSTVANFRLRMHRVVLGMKSFKLVSTGITTPKCQRLRQALTERELRFRYAPGGRRPLAGRAHPLSSLKRQFQRYPLLHLHREDNRQHTVRRNVQRPVSDALVTSIHSHASEAGGVTVNAIGIGGNHRRGCINRGFLC